jgi:hypothetical protein
MGLLDAFLRRLEGRGVIVLLCGIRADLGWILNNTGVSVRLGPNRIFREAVGPESSTLDAVRYAYDLLDGDVCATCPRRGEAGQGKEILYYMI